MAGFDFASFLSPEVGRAKLQDQSRDRSLMQKTLLDGLRSGQITQDEAVPALKKLGLDDLVIQRNMPDGMSETSAVGKAPEKILHTEITKNQSARDRLLNMDTTNFTAKQIQNRDKKITEITNKIEKSGLALGRTKEDMAALGTKTNNDVEKRILDSQEGIARLKEIQAGWNDEFTQTATKGKIKFNAFVEKNFGVNLSKANTKQLSDFTKFARSSTANLNQHIRDRTGAVMNAAEIPRLMAEVPRVGEGVFDGDSATQFKAKMDGLMQSLEAAHARLLYVKENGLSQDSAERDQEGNWKQVSSSGLSLDEFKNIPERPQQFNEQSWNKMPPANRRRLIELLKRRK